MRQLVSNATGEDVAGTIAFDTVEEALRVNTLHGAYNSFEETSKGSITAGKLADFVVLAEDLHTVDQEKIKDIEIFRTVVGGVVMYQA